MTCPEGVGEGQAPDLPGQQYLGKSHKEELVIGEPHSWQALLLPVLPQPRFVSLQSGTRVASPSGLTHHCHLLPTPPHRWASATGGPPATHIIGSLKSPIVSDVLSQCLAAVEPLPVDLVLAVLLLHAGCVVPEGRQGLILPPGPQVPFLVIFAP